MPKSRCLFVFSHLEPFYGIEKASLQLLEELTGTSIELSACVISGEVPVAFDFVECAALRVPRGPKRLAAATVELRRYLRNHDRSPDVVVGSGLWASVPLGAALVGTDIRFIHWEHSLLTARLSVDRRVRVLSAVTNLLPRAPEMVVSVSGAVESSSQTRYKRVREHVTIPNIVHEEQLPVRHTEYGQVGHRRIRLFAAGSFSRLKNHVCAIRAMQLLPSCFELALAGDGAERSVLQELVRDLSLEDRVTFLGWLPDVGTELARSDVLVHPSLSETFGFSLIEAAQHQVPVVILPAPAMDELVPDMVPGVVAANMSPRALADAIIECVAVEYWPMDEARQRRVATYDGPSVAKKWIRVLEG